MSDKENNMAGPLVTVIMPAYNAERFIEEAISSVIGQTVSDWELLVLDDCSRDGTCAIVERLAAEDGRITLLRNETNRGVSRTRNRGLDLARGRYVAFLDSDDVWHPEKLEKQIDRACKTGAELVFCSYGIVNSTGEKAKTDYIVPDSIDFDGLLKENVIGCSTVLLTDAVARQYRFQTDFYHEDYVLWLSLLKQGYKAAGCTEILVDWRYLENSRSFDKRKSARNRWRIYREYLGLPIWKCIGSFAGYAVSGFRKYFRN